MKPFVAATAPLRGRNLVEASAGTGKTYAIATMFVRLLLAHRLRVDQILVVTFTEAATAELRDRVRRRLRDAIEAFERAANGEAVENPDLHRLVSESQDRELDRTWLVLALQSFDQAAISTIHGFCHRMLHDNAFESGVAYDTELMSDLRPLRDEVVHDFWALNLPDAPEQLVHLLQRHGARPSALARLADRAVSSPDMRVLPPEEIALEPVPTEGYVRAFERARGLWDAETVWGLMNGLGKRLPRNNYQSRSIEGYKRRVTQFFDAGPRMDFRVPDVLERFGTGFITGRLKSGSLPEHGFFAACDELLEEYAMIRAALEPQVAGFKQRLIGYVRKQLRARKHDAGVLSFDDLLQDLRDGLRTPGGDALARTIVGTFPVVLIDEFQDTDPVQYEIFSRICNAAEGSTLYLIGDPKQAIYAFRGADVFTYMGAKRTTDPEAQFGMKVNWRSDPGLVTAINEIFGLPRPFLFETIGHDPVQPRPEARDVFDGPESLGAEPFQLLFVDGARTPSKAEAEGQVAELTAAEISNLLRSGATLGDGADARRVVAGDICVLTRKNKQALRVQQALHALNIPSVVVGDSSVFATDEAREIQRILGAVVEPTSGLAIKAALATELLGQSAHDLAALDTDEQRWEEWVGEFRRWHELWATRGFVQMFRALLARQGVQERLLGLADGERRMTNVLHLAELLHTNARAGHLGPTGLLHWLAHQRGQSHETSAEAAELRLESDEKAVKLTTIHKAKGLEWPIVYCPYLWDGKLLFPDEEKHVLFHDPEHGQDLTLDLGSADLEDHLEASTDEKFAENLRLLYVALTRPRHRCTVVWGRFRECKTSSLGYVVHQPPATLGETTDREEVAQRIDRLGDDDAMFADVLLWAQDKHVGVRRMPLDVAAQPVPGGEEPDGDLHCRTLERRIVSFWRTESFSGLRRHAPEDPVLVEEADRAASDEGVEELPESEPEPDEPAQTQLPADPELGARVPLADFPRGIRGGNLFHDLLEHIDFRPGDGAALEDVVTNTLRRRRFAVDRWTPLLTEQIPRLLETPLRDGEPGLCLAGLGPGDRLNELEFHMPVAIGASGPDESIGHLTRAKLARVFREHPSDTTGADYADRIERLGFLPVEGYLKGYIDLVFRNGGRYYVVDYKGNHLGERFADYTPARLAPTMATAHYVLQYHLYTVALHRYLQARLRDYDYGRDFGGSYYLFLRGMSPETGPAAGVFFEKPPLGRIEALSHLLEAPPRSRGGGG